MTSKSRIGVGSAVGALTALALLTALPAARADELADLKANQELLKQRIDQLALGAPNPVAPGSASLAGSFPRSFLIPGTNTSLAIGGFIKFDVIYGLSGLSPNNSNGATQVTGAPAVSGLALDAGAPVFNAHSRGNGTLYMQANFSRLFAETRTPTAWGEALTHLEFDFYGCTSGGLDCSDLNNGTNPSLPRLRLAYGTLGGFMAGQNWVPTTDLEAHADIFDAGGEAGSFGYARAPEFGYTMPIGLARGVTLGLFAIEPTNQTATPFGALQNDTSAVGAASVAGVNGDIAQLAVNPNKSTIPDGAFVLNFAQPWGHFRVHGIVRDMELQDGRFLAQHYIGYGAGFSGNVHPGWFGWAKDNLGFEAYAGEGMGHYNTDPGSGANGTSQALITNFGFVGLGCSAAAMGNCYGNVAATAATGDSKINSTFVRAETIPAWGGQVNYQHFWTPSLRSNLSMGVAHQDINTALAGPGAGLYNKEWLTAHANLVWQPVAFINTGVEYVFGHRVTVTNLKGDENILDFQFQVKF